MDNQEQRIFALLEIYERGVATKKEVRELELWYRSFHSQPDIMARLSKSEKLHARESMLKRIDNIIPDHLKGGVKKPALIWQRWMVAASLLIVFSIGGYIILDKNQSESPSSTVLEQDFAPGSNKAVLTLSGGRQIVLTGAKNGRLATEGGSVIQKAADGELIYNSEETKASVVMNTMSTPRGGQYHLKLSDGTNVWLNAASSITFPSHFIGNQRQVEITGEVYFEVAHNSEQPFFVKSGKQTVEVLGTHFNINAYDDENKIRTTLLDGSVVVSSTDNKMVLKPGQQSVLKDETLKILEADTDATMAWKEGYFQFVDADIETVMRQISRWYDVDVVFKAPLTKQTFTGRISRFRNISKVLKIVQSYKDVTLTFEGRRIMVK